MFDIPERMTITKNNEAHMNYPDLLPPNPERAVIPSIKLRAAYDILIKKFPKIWVNIKDGKRVNSWCGVRPEDCPVGAKKSAHKQGIAMDIHADNLKEVRAWILDGNPLGITRIEAEAATPTWIHVDFAPLTDIQKSKVCKNGIYTFNP